MDCKQLSCEMDLPCGSDKAAESQAWRSANSVDPLGGHNQRVDKDWEELQYWAFAAGTGGGVGIAIPQDCGAQDVEPWLFWSSAAAVLLTPLLLLYLGS